MRARGPWAAVPADVAVSVGMVDHAWQFGECSFVVSVAATGPARVHFSMTEPQGPTWLRLCPVRERRRARVLGAALMCGALMGAGTRGGPDEPHGRGWVHVAAAGRSAMVHLPGERVSPVGAALEEVGDLLVGLVPRRTWKDLHERRREAWEEWRERGRRAQVNRMDQTIRDWPDPAVAERTRVEAVDQGPWDARVAGARRPSEGWPGIRHGGGMGGPS